MPLSHAEGTSNSNISTYSLNGISPNSIPYLINQPTEPNLQDRKALPISLFSTSKFLDINASNIFMSLLRIANFIQTRSIKGKYRKNIFQLSQVLDRQHRFLSHLSTSQNGTTLRQIVKICSEFWYPTSSFPRLNLLIGQKPQLRFLRERKLKFLLFSLQFCPILI